MDGNNGNGDCVGEPLRATMLHSPVVSGQATNKSCASFEGFLLPSRRVEGDGSGRDCSCGQSFRLGGLISMSQHTEQTLLVEVDIVDQLGQKSRDRHRGCGIDRQFARNRISKSSLWLHSKRDKVKEASSQRNLAPENFGDAVLWPTSWNVIGPPTGQWQPIPALAAPDGDGTYHDRGSYP